MGIAEVISDEQVTEKELERIFRCANFQTVLDDGEQGENVGGHWTNSSRMAAMMACTLYNTLV
jgi:hypothetical protein